MNFDTNSKFYQVWGLTHFSKPQNCLVGWKYLDIVMGRVHVQMDALMVLMIAIIMVCCLDQWMALEMVLAMERLTVHSLVMHFQQQMDV